MLLVGGFVAMLAAEWNNPGTLGPMSVGDKILNAGFLSVMPRTAGFNSVDMAALRSETLGFHYT